MLAKKFALGFGIAIILPMVIFYGVSTFSPAPKYNEYYNFGNDYYQEQHATPEKRAELQKERQTKQQEYKVAEKRFQQYLFYVSVPIGLFAILFGAFSSIQAIGTGLMFGGIFTLTEGYVCYWSELQDWMRFLSLLVALIVLIYIGYKKLAK